MVCPFSLNLWKHFLPFSLQWLLENGQFPKRSKFEGLFEVTLYCFKLNHKGHFNFASDFPNLSKMTSKILLSSSIKRANSWFSLSFKEQHVSQSYLYLVVLTPWPLNLKPGSKFPGPWKDLRWINKGFARKRVITMLKDLETFPASQEARSAGEKTLSCNPLRHNQV